MEVEKEQIYIQCFSWGLLVVLSAGCGLAAWMHWSCIDELDTVLGFKSVEELYPSPPLGVDSADTRQLPKGEEFAWKIPILPNNLSTAVVFHVTPLQQKRRYNMYLLYRDICPFHGLFVTSSLKFILETLTGIRNGWVRLTVCIRLIVQNFVVLIIGKSACISVP
jgi:hypothetical protein